MKFNLLTLSIAVAICTGMPAMAQDSKLIPVKTNRGPSVNSTAAVKPAQSAVLPVREGEAVELPVKSVNPRTSKNKPAQKKAPVQTPPTEHKKD